MKYDIPALNLLLSQCDLTQRLLVEKALGILKEEISTLKTIAKENKRDIQFMKDASNWLTNDLLAPWAMERKYSSKSRWEEFRENWFKNHPLK